MDVLCPLHYKKVPAVSSLTVHSITLRYFFRAVNTREWLEGPLRLIKVRKLFKQMPN